MKYLTKHDNLHSTNSIHVENNILKIKDAFELKLMAFAHDCLNKKTIPLFHNYYKLQQQTHQYSTRQINTLIIPNMKTNMGASSIKCLAAKIWNSNDIAQKYRSFSKSTMKRHIFNRYSITTYQGT